MQLLWRVRVLILDVLPVNFRGSSVWGNVNLFFTRCVCYLFSLLWEGSSGGGVL